MVWEHPVHASRFSDGSGLSCLQVQSDATLGSVLSTPREGSLW